MTRHAFTLALFATPFQDGDILVRRFHTPEATWTGHTGSVVAIKK